MHSLLGAKSETFQIYAGPVLAQIAKWQASETGPDEYRLFNLGLGLGYTEWLILGGLFQMEIPVESVRWTTFETESSLVGAFLGVSLAGSAADLGGKGLNAIFASVFSEICKTGGLDVAEFRSYLGQLIKSGRLQVLNKPFDKRAAAQGAKAPFHFVLYDAYSGESQPELWEEELLMQFLQTSAAEDHCLFLTYASKGSLKRALRATGFQILPTPGFGGKRESTQAIRP